MSTPTAISVKNILLKYFSSNNEFPCDRNLKPETFTEVTYLGVDIFREGNYIGTVGVPVTIA